ncbi:hypothetical protein [Sciscionella marina]|uniref:hypothetical protein n=1 Tax=Sciscionella marina TaxID=508770 RepID=UPI0003621B2E|nr:hypothetical protein [Sciscionella marina]
MLLNPGFGFADDDLALRILATPYTAFEVTGRVRPVVGDTRVVSLHVAGEDDFPELLEQYRAERGLS